MPRKRKNATNLKGQTGRGQAQQEVLERYFEGMKVKDAKYPLTIIVKQCDIDCAVKTDGRQCVYAQACRRLFDSKAVVFFRSYAYIDLPDQKNTRFVNRFMLSQEVREKIAEFDRTGICDPGGFVLTPPTPSRTLQSKQERSKKRTPEKRAADWKRYRESVIHGTKKQRATPFVFEGELVRNGTGMVHFTAKKQEGDS